MNRKTITKIRLIQWSCFQNVTARLKGSTLFTGVNGSGKSTILDAISYLLTANTQFNLAAKDRDRTVKGYVRGDTKSNGSDQYLRSGEVVSYVAVELESETERTPFVIGVCIESPSVSDKCTSYWFILRDTSLDDVRMAEEKENKLFVYPRKQMTVKGRPLKLSEYLGREKAKTQVLRAMGLRCDPEKYRNKLVKMMAFNPENNVDQFIQNCVLEPGNVNSLKELRAQKERFEELKGIYENLRISLEKLQLVEEKTEEYEKVRQQFLNRSLMLKYQDLLYYRNEKDEIGRRIEFLKVNLENVNREITQLEVKCEAARERVENIKNDSEFVDIKSSLNEIEKRRTELEKEIGQLQTEADELNVLKEKIGCIKMVLKEDWPVDAKTERIMETIGSATGNEEKCQRAIQELIGKLAELTEKYNWKKYELQRNHEEAKNRRNTVQVFLRELENRRLTFPEREETVRRILKQELEKKHKGVQVRFLAELVSKVNDPSWRRSIETFLGNKRFHLIVDDVYVGEALQILNEKHLRDVHLVITDKIPDSEIQAGSAAGILEIPNRSARRYANYLLNGIHLCDSVEELHEYPKGGLMRDGMLAKSYSATMMDMSRTMCFMGQDAVDIQKKEYEKEKQELDGKIGEYLQQMDEIEAKRSEIVSADIRLKDYRFSAPVRLYQSKVEYDKETEAKKHLESDPSFKKIIEELQRAQEASKALEDQRTELVDRRGGLKTEIDKETQKREENETEIYLRTNQYKDQLVKYPELEIPMREDYEKLRKRTEEIRVIKPNTVEKLRTDSDRAKEIMESAQLEYLRAAGMNLEKRGISFIPFFHEEKKRISNVKIEEASNKLEAHAHEMESTFMTDFVEEMNESIRKAKEEVDRINSELRHLPFGSDTYRFVMDEREDRREFFRICQKLNEYGSVEMLQCMSAEQEEISHDIRSFMEKILSEQDESEYTDYRRYYKYDMKILSKKGGQEIESDFSKKQGSASNGEKQTPYFIILAASLIQCYPKDTECVRVAFIDEAFAALSRERIEQMVRYLEDNRFQVMYAAPPEKISSIGEGIETTVSLISTGKYTKMIEGLAER